MSGTSHVAASGAFTGTRGGRGRRGARRGLAGALLALALTPLVYRAAFELRFEAHVPVERQSLYWATLPLLLVARILALSHVGLLRTTPALASAQLLAALARAVSLGTLLFCLALFLTRQLSVMPRSVVAIEWAIASAALRVARLRVNGAGGAGPGRPRSRRVLVVADARDAHRILGVADRAGGARRGWDPVGVLLDGGEGSDAVRERWVRGVPVLGTAESLEAVVSRLGVELVVVADDSDGGRLARAAARVAPLGAACVAVDARRGGRPVSMLPRSLALALVLAAALSPAAPARAQGAALHGADVARAPASLPFGPFHLPDTLLGPPFTGAMRMVRPENVIATLDAARAARVRVVLRLVRGKRHFQNADGSFSLEKWKSEVARYRGIDFAPYVADGTLLGHYLFDEPHDPTNWNGRPVPLADIEAAAEYSKSLWPTMPTGIRSHPSFLLPGAPYPALDFAWLQWSARKGDLAAYLRQQVDAARRLDLALATSLEVLSGGTASAPMTGDQLRRWGLQLAAEPYACGLFLWKYDRDDPSYFARPEVAAAVDTIARAAARRGAPSCRRPR